MEQTVALLSKTLQNRELITDQGKAVLSVITLYDKSICYVIIRLL